MKANSVMLKEGRECLVWSPCKINPRLEVLGRRADGMHELQTTMLALDLCDRVHVKRSVRAPEAPALALSGQGSAWSADIPLNESNLAWRAARVVLDFASRQSLDVESVGIRLHIEKIIPSQAGLGGGSSNAAAAAYGVARLLDLDCSAPELLALLSELGADVAFFLAARHTGWALCRGRGERVEVLELPALDERVFVIWTPALRCSTALVYGALLPLEMHKQPSEERLDACLSLPLVAARAACSNDLLAPALRSHTGLLHFKRALDAATPGVAGLCGSGSSFYGIFESQAAAEALLGEPAMLRIERDFGLRLLCVTRARGSGVGE